MQAMVRLALGAALLTVALPLAAQQTGTVGTGAGAAAAAAGEGETAQLARAALAYGRGEYGAALAAADSALAETPGDGLAKAWRMAAQVAGGRYNSGDDVWLDIGQDPHWGAASDVLAGLARWREGGLLNADGAFGLCTAQQPAYEECRRLRESAKAGDPPPAASRWPELAGLSAALAQREAREAPVSAAVPAAPAAPAVRAAPEPTREPPAAAAPTPAAAGPRGNPATGGRPEFGRFQPGQPVLLRSAGHLYQAATVKKLGDPHDPWTAGEYLLSTPSGEWWYWYEDVYPVERDASWTAPLVGDWDVHVPMSVVTRTNGHDVYDVYTGGLRLPPLRIAANGTYSWASGKTRISGRWIARPDAPGVVLLHGDQGADWTVWLANSSSTRKVLKRDEIQMDAPGKVYQEAWRAQPSK